MEGVGSEVYVEASPAGGWLVKLAGVDVPVSRHDSEEEALSKANSYRRGMERDTRGLGKEAEKGELVGLKDGSGVLVRPVTAADKPLFVAGFARLSEESRYRRFLAAKKRLSGDELAFFTELDHHGHEALGAVDPATGEGLGVARYVCDPARHGIAEAAVAVIDDWQGRGLGRVLLERLAIRAHDEGIRHFSASLLVENRAMLALFERLGAVHVTGRDGGTEEVDVHLPITPDEPSQLTEALRIAASTPDGVSMRPSHSPARP
jgi:GNAT superfamily N-acetyltransferase